MRRNNVLVSMGVFIIAVALAGGPGCSKRKVGEGKKCRDHKDCKSGLKCVNAQCADFSGKHPSCKWSLDCLKKLSVAYRGSGEGYEVTRLYKRLSRAPYKSSCLDMPRRIASLLNNQPYKWKQMCGAPPVPKVKKVVDKSNPFRINDTQIKASGVPKEEKTAVHMKHQAYPDLCKAWVEFTLTRPFQGWVIAKFFEQYDCDEEQYKKRLRDPNLKPKCKSRRYKRDDRRYLFLHGPGTKFSYNFYVATPPEVCKKKNLSEKYHKTGCFCLGINTEKVELDFIDDPFLFHDDEMKRRKK